MSTTTMSRTADPSTSRAAAAEFEACGAKARHEAIVTATIESHPGCTTAELAEHCELDRWQVARRTKEIEERPARAIFRGASRPCQVKGRASITWWPRVKRERSMPSLFDALANDEVAS